MTLMSLNIAEIIFLIFLCIFLGALFVWIPLMILKESFQTLIGRPFGFGWARTDAEIRTKEVPQELKERAFGNIPPLRYAVYEIDGTEYTAPLRGCKGKDRCRLYVRRENPEQVWEPKAENRFAALIGILMILAFWAGLVYGGIVIARMIRG
ncbi:MAG: hypothetical protein IKG82_14125 [Oscillospiraceae bacterium]|nr:hypothetical protein [Oscillospiraceae bacterium]